MKKAGRLSEITRLAPLQQRRQSHVPSSRALSNFPPLRGRPHQLDRDDDGHASLMKPAHMQAEWSPRHLSFGRRGLILDLL
jgi:hypothetical protein